MSIVGIKMSRGYGPIDLFVLKAKSKEKKKEPIQGWKY